MALQIFALVAAAYTVSAAGVGFYPASKVTCGSTPVTLPCLNLGANQLACPAGSTTASLALPSCIKVSRQNIDGLSQLLCPQSGLDALPACVRVQDASVPKGSIPPSQLQAPLALPSRVAVLGASITSVSSTNFKSGPLSAGIFVTNINIPDGSISGSKFQPGPLPEGIKVSADNFALKSIDTAKLEAAPLPGTITVGNASFESASISPDRIAGPSLNTLVKVTDTNVQASLDADKLTCAADSVPLPCVTVDAANLKCGSGGGTTALAGCLSITGDKLGGDIPGDQIASGLLASATISPSQVQCKDSNPVPLDASCIQVNAATQLQCPLGATASPLPCVLLDAATQVDGTLTTAKVPSVSISGEISGADVTISGSRILPRTIGARAIPLPQISSVNANLDSSTVMNVEVCCPEGGAPFACNTPVVARFFSDATLYLASIDIGAGENGAPDTSAQTCCHWRSVTTNSPSVIAATFKATCVNTYFVPQEARR